MFRIKERNAPYEKKRVGENLYDIRFKSSINTFDPKNDTVYCLLKDSKTKNKACILVHGLGMHLGSKWDESLRYVPQEMGAFLIDLPYHRHRETGKNLLVDFKDGIFSLNFFRQGVLDIISTVDILKDLGYQEISIIGISLGSFFSLIAMSLDSRIKKGVLILCGGDQGVITWKSPAMIKVRKQHREEGITRAHCMKCRSFFPEFIKTVKNGNLPEDIKSDVICFYFDPLSFAPLVNSDRVLMINALFDIIIPREATIKLYKALGKPLIKWLPAGHLSLFIFKNKVISYIRSFLLYHK
jgi:cephalosporin-C deacetylase-like acetyl esterase